MVFFVAIRPYAMHLYTLLRAARRRALHMVLIENRCPCKTMNIVALHCFQPSNRQHFVCVVEYLHQIVRHQSLLFLYLQMEIVKVHEKQLNKLIEKNNGNEPFQIEGKQTICYECFLKQHRIWK